MRGRKLVAFMLTVALVLLLPAGIEEIGVSIEEPFTILPLEVISRTIEGNVKELQARAPACRSLLLAGLKKRACRCLPGRQAGILRWPLAATAEGASPGSGLSAAAWLLAAGLEFNVACATPTAQSALVCSPPFCPLQKTHSAEGKAAAGATPEGDSLSAQALVDFVLPEGGSSGAALAASSNGNGSSNGVNRIVIKV